MFFNKGNKKYELLKNNTIEIDGKVLYRIKALRSFFDVSKGDLGGYVESENNLSQDGDCWVYKNAKVYDQAVVQDNARVTEDAMIFEYAMVMGDSKVAWNAQISGHARVYDNAQISGHSKIYGSCQICEFASIRGESEVFDNAEIYGFAIIDSTSKVYDNAQISGHAYVGSNSSVFGYAKIGGHTAIFNGVSVHGYSEINGYFSLNGDVDIQDKSDYVVFKNWWSSGRYFVWTRSNNMWTVGCFHGTGEELIAKAYKDSEESGRNYELIVKLVEENILKDKE